MSGLKPILKNMTLLGVLVFAIMNFIIIIQTDGNMSQNDIITNNSLINDSYGDLGTSLNSQSSAENSLNSLEDIPSAEKVGDLDVGSTVSATRTGRAIVVGLWNIYVKLPMVILGVSPVVAGAITTILLLFLVFGIWGIWKGAFS
jgi:hypothetical protein